MSAPEKMDEPERALSPAALARLEKIVRGMQERQDPEVRARRLGEVLRRDIR